MDWSKYDWCERCDAQPGQPCMDMRYLRYLGTSHQFNTDKPHQGRKKQK